MDQSELATFQDFARLCASAAAAAIMPHFRQQMDIEDKGGRHGFDPVTVADRTAEQAIRTLIETHHADHGIEGEEFGLVRADAKYRWVIDPIDGTKSFMSGMPGWGILIALLESDSPVLGVMHQPFIGEMFEGDGHRSDYAGRLGRYRLKTSGCTSVEEAVLVTTSPQLLGSAENIARFRAVESIAKLSRYGGDCYGYCMLAAGHVDLVVEAGLNRYDIAALIPIVEGAGGVVTDWSGGSALDGTTVVAAATPALHEQARALLEN
jgi:histidinol-phosphatase